MHWKCLEMTKRESYALTRNVESGNCFPLLAPVSCHTVWPSDVSPLPPPVVKGRAVFVRESRSKPDECVLHSWLNASNSCVFCNFDSCIVLYIPYEYGVMWFDDVLSELQYKSYLCCDLCSDIFRFYNDFLRLQTWQSSDSRPKTFPKLLHEIMVAPHVETQLTRSLVRVPNSGRDRRAGAVLHDLSRVSSAAALVPITSYFALGILPSTLSPPPQPSSLLSMDTNPLKSARALPRVATAEDSIASRTRVMSRNDERVNRVMSRDNARTTNSSSATVNPTASRKRLMQQDNNSIPKEEVRSPKVPRTTTTMHKRPIQQSRRSTSRLVAGGVRTMEQLMREREQLIAENMALKLELSRRLQQQRIPSGTVGH